MRLSRNLAVHHAFRDRYLRMNQLTEVLSSEFRGDTSGSRLRLGIFFSVIAILLIGLFTSLLMMPSPVVEATLKAEAE